MGVGRGGGGEGGGGGAEAAGRGGRRGGRGAGDAGGARRGRGRGRAGGSGGRSAAGARATGRRTAPRGRAVDHDQQIERRAVERQLLDGIAAGGVRLDAAERRDPVAGVLDPPLNRCGIDGGGGTEVDIRGDRDRLERRQLCVVPGREGAGDAEGVLAFGRAVVGDADLTHSHRLVAVPGGRDRNRTGRAVERRASVVADQNPPESARDISAHSRCRPNQCDA